MDLRKLSRRDYDRMTAIGMFADERVELLHGVLVTLTKQSPVHATITAWLAQRLIRLLDDTYDVRAHSPYAASDDSQPQPDISISRRTPGVLTHPDAALLVIEVADGSLRKDREIKAPIYGESRVPEYWIVDVSGPQIEVHVHTRPAVDGYRHVETLRPGDTLRPSKLPGVEIAIADIP